MGLCALTRLKEAKEISSPIPYMHGQRCGGNTAQTADQAHPDIGFSFGSLASLASGFPSWDRLTHKHFLHGAAQDFSALWQNGQHGLQHQPKSCSLANRTQTPPLVVTTEIQLRPILHQQHHCMHGDLLTGLLPMRPHQSLKGHIGFSKQTIQSPHVFPGVHLSGQGSRGILSHPRGCFHSTSPSANIFELARSKGLFGPALRVQQFLCVHLPILAVCYMCIKVRALPGGS